MLGDLCLLQIPKGKGHWRGGRHKTGRGVLMGAIARDNGQARSCRPGGGVSLEQGQGKS